MVNDMFENHRLNEKKCRLCPRNCNVDRDRVIGVCGCNNEIRVARAALHLWEEPCISGRNGSGAVFFSGCALHCVYCQNTKISVGESGEKVSTERLKDIFFELSEKNADNINLVTGDHFIPGIADAIALAKERGFDKPFIYNCSGYEKKETLKLLDGLIDVYLPDFKYMENDIALKYSKAADYPEVAKEAISEMVRQCPSVKFDGRGLIKNGVIVRHLLLPGHVKNGKKVLSYLHETYGESIYMSIMSQYTPMAGIGEKFPELDRRVTRAEYDRLVDYAIKLGIKNAYIQDRSVAKESFIPEFTSRP